MQVNTFVAVIDASGKRVFNKKIPNEAEIILSIFRSFQEEMTGVVVESTFNWYWLVDLLGEAGYRVHLANPSAIQKYSGLKHSDDKHDAFWLAEMLRLAPERSGRFNQWLKKGCNSRTSEPVAKLPI